MCGISGGWFTDTVNLNDNIQRSLALISNRGPNDQGYEITQKNQGSVCLGHTRLSIIDLSNAGHQPMTTQDKKYSIVFNGEIYNYRELRSELAGNGYNFTSDSDTEVLLVAWQEWREECLSKLEGMFSFVIYDHINNLITCVRDAFGIKPFFYFVDDGSFGFSSELPALRELKPGKHKLNWQRSYDYLVYGDYDSSSETFVDGISHLMPGHLLTFDIKSREISEPKRWWKPTISQSSTLSFSDASEQLREMFLHNVKLHLRSDVAIGAALSGGIDSSAIVCAMRHIEPDMQVNTFSYIAEGSDLSEEYWVDRVNTHINATSFKVTASGSQLATDLDDMIAAQGEPFGSTSIYAQYRVFQLARAHGVTVTLDGQGADELLAGYIGYPGQRMLSMMEDGQLLEILKFVHQWSKWPGRSLKQGLQYFASALTPDELYTQVRRMSGRSNNPNWVHEGVLLDAGVAMKFSKVATNKEGSGRRVIELISNLLQNRGLPGLLRHGDRNSMRFSVESRVPFLTPSMADFLYSLPENYLISNSGETKSIFRAAMRGIVPDDVLDRKDKIGFATPERDWLLEMRPVVKEWLQASEQVPFINRKALLAEFDDVMDGRKPFNWQVWRWVNFIRWFDRSGLLSS